MNAKEFIIANSKELSEAVDNGYDIRLDEPELLEWMEKYAQSKAENLPVSDVRFQLPSDKQMIEIAILFNDGKLEPEKLSEMVGYGQFIVDRLYENGDVGIPSSKEGGDPLGDDQ